MTPEEQAALDAAQEKQIRELAAQITQMSKLGFDPLTIRKGIVAAVSDTTSPPTVAINISGDATTLVSQVRTLNNYTPVVGQTVLVGKQGTEIFLLGAISAANPMSVNNFSDNGWIRATLTNGSHGGNSNGDVYYRRVLDHGSWKMQWRGGWSPAGATAMIDTADALGTDYRPSSHRSVLCARALTGETAAQFDFHTNGRVVLTGGTTATNSASVSLGGSTGSASTSSYVEHSHGGAVATAGITHNDGFHSHSWSDSASHSHTPTAPSWVSLNGLEYFL